MRRSGRQTWQALGPATLLAAWLGGAAVAGEGGRSDRATTAFTAEQVRFFEEKAQPILKARCLKCHGGSGKIRGGFRLDDRSAVLKGGDLGPAVSLGQPDESLLLRAIRYEELEMPPGGKLPPGEVERADALGEGGSAVDLGAEPGRAGGDHTWNIRVSRFRRGDRRGAPAIPAPAGHPAQGPHPEGPSVGPQSDRRLPQGPARGGRPAPGARGRSRHPHPPADLRLDRAASHARGG